MDLRAQLKIAKDRAYSLKTKKAQTKAWAHVHRIEREILDIMYIEARKYATHSVRGTVISDNSHCMSEYIMIETAEYGIIHAHPQNDVLSKSWYARTCCVEYKRGQTVVVEIDVDVNSDGRNGPFLEVIPKRMSGGVLNESKYAELCKRDDLAFFKYPNANSVTGLFKTGGI